MKEVFKRFLDTAGSLTMDILMTLLSCFAVSVLLYHLTGQEVGLWQCAAYVLCAVAICVLFSREKLTLPLSIAVPLLALLGIGIAALLRVPVLPYLGGFFAWVLDGIPKADPYSFDLSLHVVRCAMLLPVAALLLLYHRRLFLLTPMLLLSAAIVVYAQYNELPGRYVLLCVLLVECLTGLATTTHRAVRRALRGKVILPEAAMRGAAMLFSILVALLSMRIARAPDGAWTSKMLHQITNDISDFVQYQLSGGGSSSGFSISWSGFAPDGDQLGGDIHPDSSIVMRVKTDTPTLLTGSIYDTYDGGRWYDSHSDGNFRLNSILWSAQQREAFASSNPQGGRIAKQRYDAITVHTAMYLVPGFLYQNYFFSGRPVSWEFGKGCQEAHFNSQGEVFMNEPPLSGVSYSFQSVSFDFYAHVFEPRLIELEAATLTEKDPLFERMCEAYLDLPDTLPRSVYDAAEEISAQAQTPAEKAFALCSWLRDNCTYTTTPGSVQRGEDFVAQFLESREGYCTYYATAMTVLARCVGLPARYVTGFGMKRNPEPAAKGYVNYNYLVTNDCAHAWSEVYLSGIGWVPFDPSDFQLSEFASIPTQEHRDASGGAGGADSSLEEALKALEEAQLPELQPEIELPEDSPVHRTITISWEKLLVVFAVLLLLLLLLLLRLRRLRELDSALLRRIQRRFPGRNDAANALYDRILDQLGYLGIAFLPGETLLGFQERLCRHFESDQAQIRAALRAIERMDYGLIQPEQRDLERLSALSVRLEQALRDELGRRTYFWRRVVFNYYPGKRRRGTRRQ